MTTTQKWFQTFFRTLTQVIKLADKKLKVFYAKETLVAEMKRSKDLRKTNSTALFRKSMQPMDFQGFGFIVLSIILTALDYKLH